MITYKKRDLSRISHNQSEYDVEAYGLSTDTKPSEGIANGSLFVEMDTSSMYFYDGESGSWLKWGA